MVGSAVAAEAGSVASSARDQAGRVTSHHERRFQMSLIALSQTINFASDCPFTDDKLCRQRTRKLDAREE
eukprot:286507-Rhodomonas_salina.1